MTYVRFAVEGTTDEPVADRLIREVDMEPMPTFIGGGKTQLDPKLPGYNQAARRSAWLVLRDLDHDDAGGCVPRLIEDLLGSAPSAGMAFRIAVREVEAWLLADAAGCIRFFNDYGETDAPTGKFVAISAGDDATCGILRDGHIQCWGINAVRIW